MIREHLIQFRVNEKEMAAVKTAAAEAGLTTANFMRLLALSSGDKYIRVELAGWSGTARLETTVSEAEDGYAHLIIPGDALPITDMTGTEAVVGGARAEVTSQWLFTTAADPTERWHITVRHLSRRRAA